MRIQRLNENLMDFPKDSVILQHIKYLAQTQPLNNKFWNLRLQGDENGERYTVSIRNDGQKYTPGENERMLMHSNYVYYEDDYDYVVYINQIEYLYLKRILAYSNNEVKLFEYLEKKIKELEK